MSKDYEKRRIVHTSGYVCGRHNSLVSLEYRSQLKLKVGHLYLVKVVEFFC